jgi:nucleotide-binding universal stress UspA family protein
MHQHRDHHSAGTSVVLVGVTGTPASRAALRQAALDVRADGGVLHLVHAYDGRDRFQHEFDRRRAPGDVAFVVCPRGEAEELLSDEAQRIAGLGVRVVFHAVPRHPAEALRDLAEELVADAVVLGSSRPRPRRFGLAARLERDCPCAVRIVHADGEETVRTGVARSWTSARV